MAKFKQLLMDRLKNRLTAEELVLLPGGFQQIGDKAILSLRPELLNHKIEIAEQLMDIFTRIRGVYLKKGAITGEFRSPQIEFILGENAPETVHREHGIFYKFDITKIMFAKGNINERLRISQLVQPNEVIFDLFAGIGYFSLLAAKSGKPTRIYAFELNPIAFKYLNENIQLNQINKDRQILIPTLGDSNIEALKINDKADRVIMGMLPAPRGHIDTVFKIVKERAMVHYEGVIGGSETEANLFNDFEEINKIYKRNIELTNVTHVKSYGPKLYHVTLDIKIS